MLTSFDGGRLFGQVHGSGAPLAVALHGWRRDHRDFDLVLGGEAARPATSSAVVATGAAGSARDPSDLPLPSSAIPSIALDLPGFGATPAPPEAWGSAGYAGAVARLLDDLDAPVVLLGHSFGGRVAVHLAAARPEHVAGVVLTGAPLFAASSVASAPGTGRRRGGPRPPARLRIGRALARGGLIGEERLEALRQRYGSADYRAAAGVMRDVLVKSIAEEREESYTPALAAITCPVELVWGELDTAAPPAVAERIASALRAPCELVVVPGVDHFTPQAWPGRRRAGVDRQAEQTAGAR